jgi:hypothetical protein
LGRKKRKNDHKSSSGHNQTQRQKFKSKAKRDGAETKQQNASSVEAEPIQEPAETSGSMGEPFQDYVLLGDPTSLKQAVIEYIPVGLLTLIVYLMTLCPTVPGGDSGELITVSTQLGLSHPPGYPLYTMLGYLFSKIPFFSAAQGVNFMSGAFQIVAGFFLFATFRRWHKNTLLGWLIVGVFSFSPLIWRYAVVAEVFTLNNLFLSALTYILYRLYEEPRAKWVVIFAAVFGLACSHHHTILFFVVPFFLCDAFYHRKIVFEPKTFFGSIGVWALGFLPYLYMPFAAAPMYIFNWGHAHTWDGFWTHFLRSEYGTFQLASGKKDYTNFWFSLWKYFGDTLDQFLVIGVIPILVAILYLLVRWSKQKPFAKTLLFSTAFYLLVFHVLANMDLSNRLFFDIQSRFWMAPNMMMSLFMGWGLLLILRRVFVGQQVQVQRLAVSGLILAAIGTQIGMHYKLEDYSKNYVFRDVGISMLDSVPENSILFLRGDIYVNVVRYLQAVEGYRTDVSALPFDLLWWPWMKANVNASLPDVNLPSDLYRYRKRHYKHFTLKELFDANQHRPIFIGKLRTDERKNVEGAYQIWNMGFLNKVIPKGQPFDFKEYKAQARGFEEYLPPKKTEIRDKSWEAFVYHNFWDRELGRARQVFAKAMSEGNKDPDILLYGANIMKKIIENHPTPPLVVYKNLGVAYQFLGRIDARYNTAMYNAWTTYLAKNPRGDPDLENIKRILVSYERQRDAILQAQRARLQKQQSAPQRAVSSDQKKNNK